MKKRATKRRIKSSRKRKSLLKKYEKYDRMLDRISRKMITAFIVEVSNTVLPRVLDLSKIEDQQKSKILQDNDTLLTLESLISLAGAVSFGQFNERELRELVEPIFMQMGKEYSQDIARTMLSANPDVLIEPRISESLMDTLKRSTNETVKYLLETQQTAIIGTQKTIGQGIEAGLRWEEIAQKIAPKIEADAYRTAWNRAKFVARNEVSTALGEISKTQQEDAGIELYEWQTSEDERVRDTHRNLNGKIFSWNGIVTVNGTTYSPASDPNYNGGSDTIPGQPWQCRCVALPYFPD